jgi:hypothetical protein
MQESYVSLYIREKKQSLTKKHYLLRENREVQIKEKKQKAPEK